MIDSEYLAGDYRYITYRNRRAIRENNKPFLPLSLSLHTFSCVCIVHDISHLPYNIGISTQQLISPGFENLLSKDPPVPTIALGTGCKTGHTAIRFSCSATSRALLTKLSHWALGQ